MTMTVDQQVHDKSAALSKAFGKQLGVSGATLSDRLGRAGRTVPKSVRREARALIEAEAMLAHPKLRRQVDPKKLDRAYRVSSSWLGGVDRGARRTDRVLGLIAVNLVNLGLLAAAVTAFAMWRGLI